MLKTIPLQSIRITDPFFSARIDTARSVAIPYMWNALHDAIPGLAPSGCISNFEIAAGLKEGKFVGYCFQDSDLWKWIEGAAYSLATHPDSELEKKIDESIDLAAQAQQPDGYLDTYYIINGLDQRFTNLRDNHELYVAGHMFEAATAYFSATGKRKLLNMACRVADCLDENFGAEDGKRHGYPGHQECELGLARLYGVTGEGRYLKLAKYFLDARGTQPHYFDLEAAARNEQPKPDWRRYPPVKYAYQQAHKPVREQTEATGHAVRQLYMLAGMADVGELSGDKTLVQASVRLMDNIVNRQMFITGGVGAVNEGEAFSFDYDLPPERCYTETCASIALIMAASRLNRIDPDGGWGDTVERALYNGILSGVSLDGTRYFYMNPLEVWPERCERRADMEIDPERLGWFGCACCPPNVLRTLTGLGNYIYAADAHTLLVDQYIASTAETMLDGAPVTVKMDAGLPWNGHVKLTFEADCPVQFKLLLRKPGWAKSCSLRLNGEPVTVPAEKGILTLERRFCDGDTVEIDFAMPVRFMNASLKSPNYAGRTALMRGPLVYCLEQIDNGDRLWSLSVSDGAVQTEQRADLLGGVTVLKADGLRESTVEELYSEAIPSVDAAQLTFVPYYAWGNRGKGEMSVWVRRK